MSNDRCDSCAGDVGTRATPHRAPMPMAMNGAATAMTKPMANSAPRNTSLPARHASPMPSIELSSTATISAVGTSYCSWMVSVESATRLSRLRWLASSCSSEMVRSLMTRSISTMSWNSAAATSRVWKRAITSRSTPMRMSRSTSWSVTSVVSWARPWRSSRAPDPSATGCPASARREPHPPARPPRSARRRLNVPGPSTRPTDSLYPSSERTPLSNSSRRRCRMPRPPARRGPST